MVKNSDLTSDDYLSGASVSIDHPYSSLFFLAFLKHILFNIIIQ